MGVRGRHRPLPHAGTPGEVTMSHRLLALSVVTLALASHAVGPARAGDEGTTARPVVVASPDGRVRAEVELGKAEGARSVPWLRVAFGDRPVLLPSSLQVDLADGTRLGADSVIETSETMAIEEAYRQHPGKRSRVVDRCRQ